MKTRREFFKTLAGSCAVLAACVVAPKSLMPKEVEDPFHLEVVKKPGLAKVEERLDNIDSWITITETGEGISRKRSSQEYHYVTRFAHTEGT